MRDHKDRCPSIAGTEPDGCPPDKDGDGIFDDEDDCRRTPETRNGFEDDDGCPDDVPSKMRGASGAMPGSPSSQQRPHRAQLEQPLDEAAARLRANPDYDVEVVGHTDSTGPRDYNIELSEKRATSVRDYLVSKGVQKERITIKGAGSLTTRSRATTPPRAARRTGGSNSRSAGSATTSAAARPNRAAAARSRNDENVGDRRRIDCATRWRASNT